MDHGTRPPRRSGLDPNRASRPADKEDAVTPRSILRHRRRAAGLASAIACAAVGLGACGGADESQTATPPNPPTTSDAPGGSSSETLLDRHLDQVLEDTYRDRMDASDWAR
jgi:hypothetical protein